MGIVQGKRLPLLILSAIILLNLIAISPDLRLRGISNSDAVSHVDLIQGMAEAVEQGRNPLDFWSPESSFGYPEIRTYQPLAHALVVLLYFACGKAISLATVFGWVQYLSIVLLPASFFAAAGLIGLPPMTAAAVAGLAPLIATHGLYGVEYQSFVWSGYSLFPQLIAVHLLLLAMGFGYRAIRDGRRLILTGFLLGLTALAHLVYGYMGALTLCLVALLPLAGITLAQRVWRTFWVGLAAALLALFQLLPLWFDRAIINHSVTEPLWKFDSWGAEQVLKWLFTGDLLDYLRFPVLSLLALAGVIWMVWERRRNGCMTPVHAFVLSGTILWTLLFFGRPAWGPLLLLVGISADMPIHRAIGSVHIFLILAAAIGLAVLCSAARHRWGLWAGAAALLIVLPAVVERSNYLEFNASAGTQNLAAYSSQEAALAECMRSIEGQGGRVYAGLLTNWGNIFTIASLRVSSILAANRIPTVSYPTHNMALPGDLLTSFDELRPAHYRLFDVRSVLMPFAMRSRAPKFLVPRLTAGNFALFDAPGSGLFDVVDAPVVVRTDKHSFVRVNEPWLKSNWPDQKTHLWLDFFGDAPAALPHAPPDGTLPVITLPAASPGRVISETQRGDSYEAEVEATRSSFALFKMTWHPKWAAFVDGKPARTVMLSPGFVGVPLTVGRHQIRCEYKPGNWKLPVGLTGLLCVLLLGAAERSGHLPLVRAGAVAKPGTLEVARTPPAGVRVPATRRKKRGSSAK